MKYQWKKILVFALVLLMLLPMLPVSARAEADQPLDQEQTTEQPLDEEAAEEAQPESDPEEIPAWLDIDEPHRAGETPEIQQHTLYINGDNNGAFRPSASLTRAELSKIIYSLGSYPNGSPRFSDVPATAWYATYVYALAEQGILQGFSDGSFRPNNPVTRVQLVTILQRLSGKTCDQSVSFNDVSENFWGYEAIALAESEGWVSGYPDGSFRPNRNLTRAEAVTVLNRFLGRIPDQAAIDANPYLHFFPDVQPGAWYYYQVMEASINHHAQMEESTERWFNVIPYRSDLPDGFYCVNTKLYVMQQGAFLHVERSSILNGISYTCTGSSGVCTAKTQVLALGNGSLIFLKNGTPERNPGSYTDGFYVRNGQLYVVRSGYIVHKKTSGTLNGVSYTCEGPSGICSTPDWTKLSLSGINLTVFTSQLSGTLSCNYSDVAKDAWYYKPIAVVVKLGLMDPIGSTTFQPTGKITYGQAIKAVVKLYEGYFKVEEYPYTETETQHYLKKAKEYGILGTESVSYGAYATRGDVVNYLYRAFHGRELTAKNTVEAIPDVPSTSPYYQAAMALYKAGIMKGTDDKGTALLGNNITRAEMATLIQRLVQKSERLSFSLYEKVIKKLNYGTSGSGKYALEAYQLGDGKNVMVLLYGVHGWEDHWAQDGKSLVYLADQVKAYLEKNYSLVKNGDWTVYILRCVNPDGLYLGTTNNGPGRCTTTYYDENGRLQNDRGIDINRCFDYNFEPRDNDRNFNSTEPLACAEARALASFIKKVKGSGNNILIDTHGWLSQIITSSGKGTVYRAFYRQFPDSSFNSLIGASGYVSAWSAYRVGYDSCLFELPSDITSHQEFLNSGYIGRYKAAIKELLSGYRGIVLDSEEPVDSGEFELNGN